MKEFITSNKENLAEFVTFYKKLRAPKESSQNQIILHDTMKLNFMRTKKNLSRGLSPRRSVYGL